MATTAQPLPVPKAAPPPAPVAAAGSAAAPEQALVATVPEFAEEELVTRDTPLGRLPVELDVAVPIHAFRVRSLLALEPGQVIGTPWALGQDMPLRAGDVQLAWSEFEVIDAQLAVRITRLA